MAASQHQYTTIDKLRREIRLWQILPGDGQIQLTTQTFDLDKSPDFVALSYVWGTEDNPGNARLNGKTFPIRQNLQEGLIVLRKHQSDRSEQRLFAVDLLLFWIDAICITQADLPEKSHQVAMMGDIYRRASQTVARSGPKIDDTALAFDYANQLVKRDGSDCEQKERLTRAVYNFSAREYFERIWIEQEVILSRRLHFLCGDLFCSWDAMSWLTLDWPFAQDPDGNIDMISSLGIIMKRLERDDYRSSSQQSLACLLRFCNQRECHTAHDKVYALLGLLPAPFEFDIDYNIDITKLMIQVETYVNTISLELSEDYGGYKMSHTDRVEEVAVAFRNCTPVNVHGRTNWYWNISEVLHNLSINILGGSARLDSISSFETRTVLSDFICWIVGAYGVNIFRTVSEKEETFFSVENISYGLMPVTEFQMKRIYHDGEYAFHLHLAHRPKHQDSCEEGYVLSQKESSRCRKLLETYNRDVQLLMKMRLGISDVQIDPYEYSQTSASLALPFQVRRATFASLLARQFVKKIEEWPEYEQEG